MNEPIEAVPPPRIPVTCPYPDCDEPVILTDSGWQHEDGSPGHEPTGDV